MWYDIIFLESFMFFYMLCDHETMIYVIDIVILHYSLFVVATTYHRGQMISLTSKPQSRSIMWVFTRELDKESLLN